MIMDFGNISCIGVQSKVKIFKKSSKTIYICLGQKLCDYTEIEEQIQKTKEYWEKSRSKIITQTPNKEMDILFNDWLYYQVMNSRFWGRTGYYQSGGAFGFRDQLQDCLCIVYFEPEIVKKHIILCASRGFIQGDVLHWWHENKSMGIRTKMTDDLLWLVYVVYEYIRITNDKEILNEIVPYTEGIQIPEGKDEHYSEYRISNVAEPLYEHLERIMDRSISSFGDKGLPLMGTGDWNDGMNTVGNEGFGQSAWLGFFLYDVLGKFIEITDDEEKISRYQQAKKELKKNINKNAWDGRWYIRAFFDDGTKMGSSINDECRIDSISQSWSIISGAGDNDKQHISLESAKNNLIDEANGIIKLLNPPFNNGVLEPGYIKSYLPGVRENGGQYTHAAAWIAMAFARLGYTEEANKYMHMINPINHARTKEQANKYQVEPYVVPADVYSTGHLAGRGGWTWYTGAASWIYKVWLEEILGFKVQEGKFTILPCVPNYWEEYRIKYRYKDTVYNIKIYNKAKQKTVQNLVIDGNIAKKSYVELKNDKKKHEVIFEF